MLVAVGLVLAGCTTPPEPGSVTDDEQLMRLADRLAATGDPASAAALYRQVAANDPTATEPLVALARLGETKGDFAGAAAAYQEASVRAHQDPAVRLQHARALLQAGRTGEADQAFRAILADDSTSVAAYNGLGVCLDVQNRHADAQTVYREGLKRNFSSVALRNNLALSLALSGQYDPAISGLEALSTNAEAPRRVRHNLALVYALAGKPAQAAAIERRELAPADAEANLTVYQQLNTLEGRMLAQAVFAAGLRTAPPPGVQSGSP